MARKSILGTKLGMTQVFDENNKVVPVTVVKAGPNVVTMIRTPERDGYSAVQLAYGEISPRKVNKPLTGQYAAAGVNPRRHIAEFRLDIGRSKNADPKWLLPMICRTERALIAPEPETDELRDLTFDDTGPWEFRVQARREIAAGETEQSKERRW